MKNFVRLNVTKPKRPRYERYELADSPWTKKLTQRDLAVLLGTTKDRLEALVRDHENYVHRRDEDIKGKLRKLAIPRGKLRAVHERLKGHLNKIKQPPYLYSPRKGRGQRDNAFLHASSVQVLKVDIRQFYPQTTVEDIWRWAHYTVGMREDVAGLFAKLVAIDRKMPFGSPISPVLTSLIHRPMFDRVYQLVREAGFEMSLYVDDLTISGQGITGEFLAAVRSEIRSGGFNTHKIAFLEAARPVVITGVPIAGKRVLAPTALHQRLRRSYADLKSAGSDKERAEVIDQILSALGTYRHFVGASSDEGRKAANRMHALKQRRRNLSIELVTMPTVDFVPNATLSPAAPGVPWA
ncbi:reverse transcriptase family protein [Novosphingobium gossypii]|uniref:reverse transcriptase family protein n=1 Tax=Novosphingobium gossypii TaxID=1604774 RepID=UPI003D1EDE6C